MKTKTQNYTPEQLRGIQAVQITCTARTGLTPTRAEALAAWEELNPDQQMMLLLKGIELIAEYVLMNEIERLAQRQAILN